VAKFVRAAVFSPFAVPAVIGAILWGFLYAPGTSPIVALAAELGWQVNPMAMPPLWAVGNVGIWTYVGFNVLIFLAGLAGIDPSVLESARLDGASRSRTAWSIKLPMIRPSIVLSAVFNIVGTLQLFTEPTALRTLMNTIPSGWTPNMLAYSEAAANRYSYSAAIATLLAVVTGLVSFWLLRSAGPEAR
jgi:multiple sugar transport system permease protein